MRQNILPNKSKNLSKTKQQKTESNPIIQGDFF